MASGSLTPTHGNYVYVYVCMFLFCCCCCCCWIQQNESWFSTTDKSLIMQNFSPVSIVSVDPHTPRQLLDKADSAVQKDKPPPSNPTTHASASRPAPITKAKPPPAIQKVCFLNKIKSKKKMDSGDGNIRNFMDTQGTTDTCESSFGLDDVFRTPYGDENDNTPWIMSSPEEDFFAIQAFYNLVEESLQARPFLPSDLAAAGGDMASRPQIVSRALHQPLLSPLHGNKRLLKRYEITVTPLSAAPNKSLQTPPNQEGEEGEEEDGDDEEETHAETLEHTKESDPPI
ncbi:hypothetical protein RFI_09273, partial [Reticulomyxa filosa]